jgi:DNA mismatch repair ATPase MutL
MVDQHAADEKYQFEKNLAKSKQPDCINCFEQKDITTIEADEIQECKYLLAEAGFFYKIQDNSVLRLERCPVFN